MEAINLADLYQLPLLDWASIEDKLRSGVTQAPGTGGPKRHTCWLSTINADGSPHVNGVGALWSDGCFWFETGQGSRKGRNIARDPRCALTAEFSAPSAGPPPWHVYRLTAKTATALATVGPGGATRWRF